MSEILETSGAHNPRATPEATVPGRTPHMIRGVVLIAAVIGLLALPLYLNAFWLQLGFSIVAISVGAIGLNLLTGTTGQVSLANPFFMAIGALGYVVLTDSPPSETGLVGFDLPPLLGMFGGVALAGLLGLLFSPLSARLRGIYLGMASLGLVFVSQHVLNTATPFSGGYNGRSTPHFEIFGLTFANSETPVVVLGVPFGRLEWLWYLGVIIVLLAYLYARNLLRSRPGRAMQLVSHSTLAASVVGVYVMEYKGKVFLVSSVYAGVAGVLYALSIGSIAPQSFGTDLALQYLAMIVIGGMGSVGGAIAGAVFVVSLPLVIQTFATGLPFLHGGTISPSHLAKYIYGAVLVSVLIFKPSGLAGLWRSVTRAVMRRPSHATPTQGVQ